METVETKLPDPPAPRSNLGYSGPFQTCSLDTLAPMSEHTKLCSTKPSCIFNMNHNLKPSIQPSPSSSRHRNCHCHGLKNTLWVYYRAATSLVPLILQRSPSHGAAPSTLKVLETYLTKTSTSTPRSTRSSDPPAQPVTRHCAQHTQNT